MLPLKSGKSFPRATPGTFQKWNAAFKHRRVRIVADHFLRRNGEPKHEHDFFEIQLCAGGRGWHRTGRGDVPFRSGDVLLLRPGSWHFHHDNQNVDAYVCCFGTDLLQHELLWTIDDPVFNRLLWRPPANRETGFVHLRLGSPLLQESIGHLNSLVALGPQNDGSDRRQRLGHLILILDCLARGSISDVACAGELEPVHYAVKRSLFLMEENLSEAWSINQLAGKINIDVSYLGRLFQKALGVPPLTWLNQMRAERAGRLLLSTDKSITEIAGEVGWSDAAHFAKRFRQHFGVSATAYREWRPAPDCKSAAPENGKPPQGDA